MKIEDVSPVSNDQVKSDEVLRIEISKENERTSSTVEEESEDFFGNSSVKPQISQNGGTNDNNNNKIKNGTNEKTSRKGRNTYLESYEPIPENQWLEIKEFYDFNDKFPSKCLYTRQDTGITRPKNILFINESVRPYVKHESSSNSTSSNFTKNSLNVMQCGFKFFNRNIKNREKCDARLVQDALPYALPFIGKKRIALLEDGDIPLILKGGSLDLNQFSLTLQERMKEISSGAVFLLPKSLNGENYETDYMVHQFAISVWNGDGVYMTVLLNKDNINHMRQMLAQKGLYCEEIAPPSEIEEKNIKRRKIVPDSDKNEEKNKSRIQEDNDNVNNNESPEMQINDES